MDSPRGGIDRAAEHWEAGFASSSYGWALSNRKRASALHGTRGFATRTRWPAAPLAFSPRRRWGRWPTVGAIYLGTSGWDYAEWVGRFYGKRGASDRLRYYTGFFPIVEVNSTFYRLPPVSVAQSWVRRTPPAFRFALKLPQTITHDKLLVGADVEVRQFAEFVAPIRTAGKLAAVLVQLPPSLPFEPATARRFYESLPEELPVAVEPREASWLGAESKRLLEEFRFAFVVVDEPLLPVDLTVTAPFSYVRWHGHGSQVWYDYTYHDEELREWVPRLAQLAERTEAVFGFFNNHFRGDAPVNARTLGEMLHLPPPPWSSAGKLIP